jgi:hypothetical protein
MNPSMIWMPNGTSKVLPASQKVPRSGIVLVIYPLFTGTKFSGRWIFTPNKWLGLDQVSQVAQFQMYTSYLPSGMTPARAAAMATAFAKTRPTSHALTVMLANAGMSVVRSGQATPVAYDASGNQVAVTLPSDWGWGTDSSGNPIPEDSSGNAISLPTGAVSWGSASPGTTGGTTTTTGGMSQQTQTQMLNTASALIGASASTITAAIQSGDQLQIAQLNNQTQVQLAQLRLQAMTPQNQANIASLQMMQSMLLGSQGNTTMLIMVAIGAAVVIGGLWIMSQSGGRSGSRRNPVVRRHGRRKFVSASHLRRLRGF